ncbi:MAG: hypothetical protein ABJA20_01965, partial [Novosphingobium sp.]
ERFHGKAEARLQQVRQINKRNRLIAAMPVSSLGQTRETPAGRVSLGTCSCNTHQIDARAVSKVVEVTTCTGSEPQSA